MDAFAPIGPAVVTKEEVGDPHNLNLSCTVNGEIKQVFVQTNLYTVITKSFRTQIQASLCLGLMLWLPGCPNSPLFSQEI